MKNRSDTPVMDVLYPAVIFLTVIAFYVAIMRVVWMATEPSAASRPAIIPAKEVGKDGGNG